MEFLGVLISSTIDTKINLLVVSSTIIDTKVGILRVSSSIIDKKVGILGTSSQNLDTNERNHEVLCGIILTIFYKTKLI